MMCPRVRSVLSVNSRLAGFIIRLYPDRVENGPGRGTTWTIGEARERGFAGRSALGDLTALFEQAEYRGGEFENVDLRRALDASEAVGKATHRS